MTKLIYSTITSLDAYVADENGNFDRAEPDEEVHGVVHDLERSVATYLHGRRMYEVMSYWALKAGLVDECHLFMSPVVVGGGNRAMPLEALRIAGRPVGF